MNGMNIALVGTGNVAWHFVQATKNTSIRWNAVYSRNILHRQEFSLAHGIPVIDELEKLPLDTDFVLLAISDNAISDIDSRIPSHLPVIHTAGAVDILMLQRAQRGVLWTLQSLKKNQPGSLKGAPFFIESSDSVLSKKMKLLVEIIGGVIYEANSAQRTTLHIAAVFANNFTNHLLTVAHGLLQKEDIPFDVLRPIIESQYEKLQTMLPSQIQTGPAFRNDQNTIEKHLESLAGLDEVKNIYRVMTDSIIKKYYDTQL